MKNDLHFRLATQLRGALDDINAVRRDLKDRGPFASLLERAAVEIESVRISLRTN